MYALVGRKHNCRPSSSRGGVESRHAKRGLDSMARPAMGADKTLAGIAPGPRETDQPFDRKKFQRKYMREVYRPKLKAAKLARQAKEAI